MDHDKEPGRLEFGIAVVLALEIYLDSIEILPHSTCTELYCRFLHSGNDSDGPFSLSCAVEVDKQFECEGWKEYSQCWSKHFINYKKGMQIEIQKSEEQEFKNCASENIFAHYKQVRPLPGSPNSSPVLFPVLRKSYFTL